MTEPGSLRPCRYREAAPSAYTVDERGRRRDVTVWLCLWPDQHPECFADAPPWLAAYVASGKAVDAHDCAHCRAARP